MARSHYDIKRSENGLFQFNLITDNGEVLLTSEMYASKASAEHAISSVRNACVEEKLYEIKPSKDGHHYFVLKSTNQVVIGFSEMFPEVDAAKKAVKSVVRNGQCTEIWDLTY
jgi:uncharacterized protein YegP (UPF0339 family)